VTAPTRPKRDAKKGRKAKPATEGEKIVLRHLFNIRHDDPHYDQFLDDVRQPPTYDLDRIRDAACARAIDAAIRRAVREVAKEAPHHAAPFGNTQAAREWRDKIETRYGVRL